MKISLLLCTFGLAMAGLANGHAQQLREPSAPIRPDAHFDGAKYVMAPTQRSISGQEVPSSKYTPVVPIQKKTLNSIFALGPGDSVGYTYYDFQTNSAMPDRIIDWGNNGPSGIKRSMVWMAAVDQTTNTDTRGTYGAVNDGTAWTPIDFNSWEAIENPKQRTGFCELTKLSTGQLVVANHSAVGTSLNGGKINVLVEKDPGGGNFTTYSVPSSVDGGLWPRVAVGSNDVIHVIYTYQTGTSPGPKPNVLEYVKSTDKGATWSNVVDLTTPNGTPPGVAGGDEYNISANGDHVVIWYYSQSVAIIQLKSDDNGGTWAASLVASPNFTRKYTTASGAPDSVYYPDKQFGDTVVGFRSDTVAAPGSSMDLMVSADGTVQGVFAIFPVYERRYYPTAGDTTAQTYKVGTIYQTATYYPNVGLQYVNIPTDATQGFATLLKQPGNMDGTASFLEARGYAGSYSRWPQLGVDASNKLYLAFGSGVAGDTINALSALETAPKNYMYSHIYSMYTDNGKEWSDPVNLTPNKIDAQYPSLANYVSDSLSIAYQADTYPGDWLNSSGKDANGKPTGSGLHPQLKDVVEVMNVGRSRLGSIVRAGVADQNTNYRSGSLAISTIAPNPAGGIAHLTYNIGQVRELVRPFPRHPVYQI